MRSLGVVAVFGSFLALLAGCSPGVSRQTPVYGVFWKGEQASGAHIEIAPADDISFARSTVRVKRGSLRELHVAVNVVNLTGRDLFVCRLGETPFKNLRWTKRSVSSADVSEVSGREGPVLGGCARVFDMLCAWDHADEPTLDDKPRFLTITARIPLSDVEMDTEYTDVQIEFPLIYYALGATQPAQSSVTRRMRIVWLD